MWHRVDVVLTDVSEECIASIFRVEEKIRTSASEGTVRTDASRPFSFLAILSDYGINFSIYSFSHQWLYSPLLGPGLFFSFVIFSVQMAV
jgi:hypothetical protein